MHTMDFDPSLTRQRSEDLRKEVAMHRLAHRGRKGRRMPQRWALPGASYAVEFFLLLAVGIVAVTPGVAARPALATPVYGIQELGPLVAGAESYAMDVNDAGQVVGMSSRLDGSVRAVLWEDGQAQDLGAFTGFPSSEAAAINDSGQVVGQSEYDQVRPQTRAFLSENGQLRDLGALPDRAWSSANDVNESGQVVGNSRGPILNARATLWGEGRAQDLGMLPDEVASRANAINEAGSVAGTSINSAGQTRAVLWEGGQARILGALPGGSESVAMDINDGGAVVGYAPDSRVGPRAVLWENGRTKDIGEGNYTAAFGINDAGQIVGNAGQSAVIWEDGTAKDLNHLIPADSGWQLTVARAINERGQIVGWGTRDGQLRAFLLTDKTPPETELTSGPSGSTRNTLASFAFSSTETGSSFACSLDGAEFGPCSSPRSHSGLASGRHSFRVRATDRAGNTDATPTTRTWTVDTVKPSISGTSPRSGTKLRDATPLMKAFVKDSQTNLLKGNIRLYVDGRAKSFSYSSSTDRLVRRSKKLEPGRHTARIVAKDAAGNVAIRNWYFRVARR